VDFCQVLTAAPEYQERTFRTEVIVVPDYHGRFATISQCKVRAIGFAEGSFVGSPALRRLDDEVERAYRAREDSPRLKAVAVHVTARVERIWSSRLPGILPSRPGYVLRLLDADEGRLVDVPE